MPALRSRETTHGRNAAGARALWRATGMGDDDFGRPIIAIALSRSSCPVTCTSRSGRARRGRVRAAGGVPFLFNTIGVDDGIAMGHRG